MLLSTSITATADIQRMLEIVGIACKGESASLYDCHHSWLFPWVPCDLSGETQAEVPVSTASDSVGFAADNPMSWEGLLVMTLRNWYCYDLCDNMWNAPIGTIALGGKRLRN